MTRWLPAQDILAGDGPAFLGGVPEGLDGRVLVALAQACPAAEPGRPAALLHVARDDQRMAALAAALRFFAPGLTLLEIPAWDCVPYDRISPNPEIAARRIAALSRLAAEPSPSGNGPVVVLATVNAALQRVPPRTFMTASRQRRAVSSSMTRESPTARRC